MRNRQSEAGSPKSEIHTSRKAVAEFYASTRACEWPYAISETWDARRRYA